MRFGLETDKKKLQLLDKLPFEILFPDGKHECFSKLYKYPQQIWERGKTHRIGKNIRHLMRGQVFEVNGYKILKMGGGYSIDKMFRIEGRTWWPEELLSNEEYCEVWENLAKTDYQVDYMISHAAPDKTMQFLYERGIFSNSLSRNYS